MQFKLVYENAQDDTIRGSIENIPTNNDEILCKRSDLENKGLVYETRDTNDGLVIMTSEDHLPGGDDDCQVYPTVEKTPVPDPKPGDGGTGDNGDNGGTEVGGETGGENGGGQTGGETGETEVPKVEE